MIALAWMLGMLVHSPEPTGKAPADGWVRIWTDRETPYDHGDPVRVFLRLDRPAYVTTLRVDTDGRVRVLFPHNPWGDNYVAARHAFEITGRRDDYAFAIDEDAGIGYIFVIASPRPFDYTGLARDDYWDYRLINGGRIRGDPYVALTDLAERLAPDEAYDYDIASYAVGRHYDYPRFVCAQCHSHPRDRTWDEYRLTCARFRLVIYDDPSYYPYRYDHGRGRNVVVDRPLHPGPRFVFRDAHPGTDYVTRLRGQPDDADRRRAREFAPARPLVERHPIDEPRREAGRRVAPRYTPPDDTDLGPAPAAAPAPASAPAPERLAPAARDSETRPAHEPRSIGSPELRRRKR